MSRLSGNLASEEDLTLLTILVRRRLYPKLLQHQGKQQYLSTYPEINRALFRTRWLPWYFKAEHIAICLNLFPLWYRLGMPIYKSLKRKKARQLRQK